VISLSPLPRMSKAACAERILDAVVPLLP